MSSGYGPPSGALPRGIHQRHRLQEQTGGRGHFPSVFMPSGTAALMGGRSLGECSEKELPPSRNVQVLSPMENPHEPAKDDPSSDPAEENPFPLTTEWFEHQRHEATEAAMRKKAERALARANKDKTSGRRSGFLRRWRSRPTP